MSLRLPYYELSSDLINKFIEVKKLLEESSLNKNSKHLIELVYLRISQINGCAYCLDLHSNDLRKNGETTKRLDALAGWKISNLFTSKERSALQWAEALTHISKNNGSDEDYNDLKEHFSDQEISDLTFAISLMNGLNRVAISMRQ